MSLIYAVFTNRNLISLLFLLCINNFSNLCLFSETNWMRHSCMFCNTWFVNTISSVVSSHFIKEFIMCQILNVFTSYMHMGLRYTKKPNPPPKKKCDPECLGEHSWQDWLTRWNELNLINFHSRIFYIYCKRRIGENNREHIYRFLNCFVCC